MAIGQELERANGTNMSMFNGGLSTSLHVDSLMERGSSSENENMVKSDFKDPTSPSLSPAPNADRLAEYELTLQLGDGAYGTVTSAIHRKTGQTVAVKRMKSTYLSWKDALKEMEIVVATELKRHPNIIHMLEAFREAQQLYMVFEYMQCNLYQLMKERATKRFSEDETRSISGQVLYGLQYLHEKGFFHRDLKPENILCNGTEVVKIADFGQARLIRSRPPYTEYVSTRWYRAPELVLSSRVYGVGVDIWAIGCIMAEIVTLRPLFDGSTAADQLFKIVKLLGTPKREEWPQGYDMADRIKMSFPPGFERQKMSLFIKPASSQCEEVIVSALQYNPQARPSAKACLQMPFFAKSFAAKKSWDPNSGETLTWKRQQPAGPVKQKTELLLNVQPTERSFSDPLALSSKKVLPELREPATTSSQPFIPATVSNQPPSRRSVGPSGHISKASQLESSSNTAKAKNPNHAHLFRRYESQNSIPVSKLPLGASGIDKNNLQKFALQMEKVTKSSTIPDMLNMHVAPAGDQKKPRFRTEKAPLQPAKFGHMQRILLPRGDSQRTLDVNAQKEPLNFNIHRKIGGDGSHSDGEFPDLLARDSKFEDTVVAKAENQLDQLWASHARNLAVKPPRFTISRKASMASSLGRPPAAHSSRTVPQAAPAGDTLQRRSHEPSWWDK